MRKVFLFLAVAVSIVIRLLFIGQINIDQDWLAHYGKWAWQAGLLTYGLPVLAQITPSDLYARMKKQHQQYITIYK